MKVRCRSSVTVGATPDKRFEPLLQCPPGEHDPMLAAVAAEANIGSQPDNRPLMATARMRLPQPHHILQANEQRSTGHVDGSTRSRNIAMYL